MYFATSPSTAILVLAMAHAALLFSCSSSDAGMAANAAGGETSGGSSGAATGTTGMATGTTGMAMGTAGMAMGTAGMATSTTGPAGMATSTIGGSSGGASASTMGAMITGSNGVAGKPIKVLIWNTALTYGHQSRFTAIPLLQAQASANNIEFDTTYAHVGPVLAEGQTDSTSDPSVFTDAGLDPYDVVFFLNTTGNTIDGDDPNTHRQALIDFITKKGRGFVGTHSATDSYDTGWTWYTDFIGANFKTHSSANTPGTARYANGVAHPILMAAATPNPWNRSEEWYVFTRDPRSSAILGIEILLTCTDTSNQFGERPSAWVHDMPGGGRMFYTAFGHDVSAFQEKSVMDLIIAGIQWAAHRLG